jgi:hypothetical protein
MKFYVNVVSLEATQNSFPTIGGTNMADARTCEMGVTLALLNVAS